jgi:hypothetical protein
MEEAFLPVQLKDGRWLEVELSETRGTMSATTVRLTTKGRTVAEARLPYPDRGLAGGRIILSPSEHFAVVSMFSGQSEEGYELFRVDTGLERVASMGYQPGEVASFCFSEQEDVLLMALPQICSEWWLLWEEGQREPDSRGRLSFRFGEIRHLVIKANRVSVHEIRISVNEGWEPSHADYDPDLKPRLEAKRLVLSMPWGEAEIPVPIPSTALISLECDDS